jgi:uncharacterized damage-inducible protein DinB
MAVRDSLLPEFDHEMAVTRRVLERLPESAWAWRPHEKSFDLGGLAAHVARIPRWGRSILDGDSYDLDRETTSPNGPAAPVTLASVLETFDRHVGDLRRQLLDRSDAELMAPWALKRGTHLVMSMPRLTALRSFVLHHLIHHRGQLTVYLRLQDVPIPPLYGSTADERM